MPKARTIKRPPYHHVIIWGYVLAPVANVILVSLFLDLPISQVLDRFVSGFGSLAAIWLLTAPLVGLGLYLVNRFSWYLFLAHSSLILIDFVVKWVARPLFFLGTIPPLNNLLILLGNLTLVGFIGYTIQRDFRSPYLRALRRSWRAHRRIPVRQRVEINGVQAMVGDLSVGGCFVPIPGGGHFDLSVGDQPRVQIRSHSLDIETKGEVMRKMKGGYGIRFLSLSRRSRRQIRRIVQARFGLRYLVEFPAEWIHDTQGRAGLLFDLSSKGCFLATEVSGVESGEEGLVSIVVDSVKTDAPARVIWVNGVSETDRPQGFGMQFLRPQKKLLRRASKTHGPLEHAR